MIDAQVVVRHIIALRGIGIFVGVVPVVVAIVDQVFPILPIAAVVGSAGEHQLHFSVPILGLDGAGVRIDNQLRLERLRRLHRGVALKGRPAVRQQSVLCNGNGAGDLPPLRIGQHRRQIPAGTVGHGRRRRAGQSDRDFLRGHLAALFFSAALELGQPDRERTILLRVVGDQLHRDLDLVDGAREGQLALGPGVVHAGLGRTIHGLIVNGDVVALVALAADRHIDGAGAAVGGQPALGEAQRGGAGLVVVRNHESHGIAGRAELTAAAARDREQGQLRQLGNGVVQRRHTDVLDRLAVGKGQVEFIQTVGVVRLQSGKPGLVGKGKSLRHDRGLRDRRIGFAHQGFGAVGPAVYGVDAAQVRPCPGVRRKVPEQVPGRLHSGIGAQRAVQYVGLLCFFSDSFSRFRLVLRGFFTVELLQILPVAVLLCLPAVAVGPDVFGQAQDQSGALGCFLRHVRDHGDAARQHFALPFRHADGLVGRDGIRVLKFDQKIVPARGGIVIDELFTLRVSRDRGREGDLHGNCARGTAQAVDRDQHGFRQGLTLGSLRAGFADVGLVAAESKGAVGEGRVPVILHGDLPVLRPEDVRLFALGYCRRALRGGCGILPAFLRNDLYRQDRKAHHQRQEKCDQASQRVSCQGSAIHFSLLLLWSFSFLSSVLLLCFPAASSGRWLASAGRTASPPFPP